MKPSSIILCLVELGPELVGSVLGKYISILGPDCCWLVPFSDFSLLEESVKLLVVSGVLLESDLGSSLLLGL